MSEFLNNQETKEDTKNGFTVLMGLKERNKKKEPGRADQTGRRGDELTIFCAIHFPND